MWRVCAALDLKSLTRHYFADFCIHEENPGEILEEPWEKSNAIKIFKDRCSGKRSTWHCKFTVLFYAFGFRKEHKHALYTVYYSMHLNAGFETNRLWTTIFDTPTRKRKYLLCFLRLNLQRAGIGVLTFLSSNSQIVKARKTVFQKQCFCFLAAPHTTQTMLMGPTDVQT